MNILEFNEDKSKCLSESSGREIIANGKYLGSSEIVNDTLWGGHKYHDAYYLALNNDDDTVWQVTKEIIEYYIQGKNHEK